MATLELAEQILKTFDIRIDLREGSPFRTLILLPASKLFDEISLATINDLKSSFFLANASSMTVEQLGLLAENFLQARQTGSRTSGPVRIFFNHRNAQTLLRDDLAFKHKDGTQFRLTGNIQVSFSDYGFDAEKGFFYVDIIVESIDEGAFIVAAGDIVAIEGDIIYERVENLSDFVIGKSGDTVDTLLEKVRASRIQKNLLSAKGIKSFILDPEAFPGVIDVLATGFGAPEMSRDVEIGAWENQVLELARFASNFKLKKRRQISIVPHAIYTGFIPTDPSIFKRNLPDRDFILGAMNFLQGADLFIKDFFVDNKLVGSFIMREMNDAEYQDVGETGPTGPIIDNVIIDESFSDLSAWTLSSPAKIEPPPFTFLTFGTEMRTPVIRTREILIRGTFSINDTSKLGVPLFITLGRNEASPDPLSGFGIVVTKAITDINGDPIRPNVLLVDNTPTSLSVLKSGSNVVILSGNVLFDKYRQFLTLERFGNYIAGAFSNIPGNGTEMTYELRLGPNNEIEFRVFKSTETRPSEPTLKYGAYEYPVNIDELNFGFGTGLAQLDSSAELDFFKVGPLTITMLEPVYPFFAIRISDVPTITNELILKLSCGSSADLGFPSGGDVYVFNNDTNRWNLFKSYDGTLSDPEDILNDNEEEFRIKNISGASETATITTETSISGNEAILTPQIELDGQRFTREAGAGKEAFILIVPKTAARDNAQSNVMLQFVEFPIALDKQGRHRGNSIDVYVKNSEENFAEETVVIIPVSNGEVILEPGKPVLDIISITPELDGAVIERNLFFSFSTKERIRIKHEDILAGAPEGITIAFRTLSGIGAVQTAIDTSELRYPGQDILVRAFLPVFVDVHLKMTGAVDTVNLTTDLQEFFNLSSRKKFDPSELVALAIARGAKTVDLGVNDLVITETVRNDGDTFIQSHTGTVIISRTRTFYARSVNLEVI